jgi:hypothetical protein
MWVLRIHAAARGPPLRDLDLDGGGRFAPVLAYGEQPPFHDF